MTGGFRIIHPKMEYMDCNFSRDMQRDVALVRVEAREIP